MTQWAENQLEIRRKKAKNQFEISVKSARKCKKISKIRLKSVKIRRKTEKISEKSAKSEKNKKIHPKNKSWHDSCNVISVRKKLTECERKSYKIIFQTIGGSL